MNAIVIVLVVVALAWAVGFGLRSARLAGTQRRSADAWFVLGAVLGPLALTILRTAPPGACATCLSPVEGWSFQCPLCGSDVREGPLPVKADVPASVPEQTDRPERQAPRRRGIGARRARGSPAPAAAEAPGTLPDPKRPRRLASAVFVEGSERLQPGTWYQLAIHGEELRITGPLSALPDHETLARRLGEIRLTTPDDRLVVTGATPRLADFHLVFTSVRDATARGLAQELDEMGSLFAVDGTAPAR